MKIAVIMVMLMMIVMLMFMVMVMDGYDTAYEDKASVVRSMLEPSN